MLLKRAGDVVCIRSVGDSTIAQGGPIYPADDSVLAVEHAEENSFILCHFDLAGWIRAKGHFESVSLPGYVVKSPRAFPIDPNRQKKRDSIEEGRFAPERCTSVPVSRQREVACRKRTGSRAGLSNADGWLHTLTMMTARTPGSVSQLNGTNSQRTRLRGAASSIDTIRSEQAWTGCLDQSE
jgi:hypothetical protein